MTRALVMIAALLASACGGAQRPGLPPGACRPADDEARPWETRQYGMSVPWFAPRRGAARPRVVIQVFSDFECPYCARAVPTLDRVIEEYGACVQIVWRNRPMPYHEHAELAARAALEIYRQRGDEAFWRYHDLLFADQAALAREDLERHARAIGGVDREAFGAALDGDAHAAAIERDRDTIRRTELPIGTPSFFVNGALLHGARPYVVFARAIEDALLDAYAAPSSPPPPGRGGAAAEPDTEPEPEPEPEPASASESASEEAGRVPP